MPLRRGSIRSFPPSEPTRAGRSSFPQAHAPRRIHARFVFRRPNARAFWTREANEKAPCPAHSASRGFSTPSAYVFAGLDGVGAVRTDVAPASNSGRPKVDGLPIGSLVCNACPATSPVCLGTSRHRPLSTHKSESSLNPAHSMPFRLPPQPGTHTERGIHSANEKQPGCPPRELRSLPLVESEQEEPSSTPLGGSSIAVEAFAAGQEWSCPAVVWYGSSSPHRRLSGVRHPHHRGE